MARAYVCFIFKQLTSKWVVYDLINCSNLSRPQKYGFDVAKRANEFRDSEPGDRYSSP